jgi:hypothetical protein
MLAGGGPQSKAAGTGESELSPSGFFDDQADLAWCFALRFPPPVVNGEGEAVGGKVTGSGRRGVIDVPSVKPKGPWWGFWGVLNSTLVPIVVQVFVLRSGLSRAPKSTFFNL